MLRYEKSFDTLEAGNQKVGRGLRGGMNGVAQRDDDHARLMSIAYEG